MDVITAAWSAAGGPQLPPAAGTAPGRCARCGAAAMLAAVSGLLSRNFTSWDGWARPAAGGLCAVCAWAYRAPCLRLVPLMVTVTWPGGQPAGTLTHPGRAELTALLSQPLPSQTAVIVPLRPGRKHLLPQAQWGQITVDDTCLPWLRGDASRLQALQRLRRCGFGSHMLAAPVPAYPVLRRLPPSQRAEVLADWDEIADWRRRRPWMQLAVHLTTPGSPATRDPSPPAGPCDHQAAPSSRQASR